MTFLKTTLIASLAAVIVAFGSQYYARLERDHEIARLRKENAHMRLAVSQPKPFRPLTRDPAVQSAASDLAGVPTEVNSRPINNQPTLAGGSRRWPARTYQNAGQATPIATLQTMAWACDRGDVETMARLFIIGDEARPKANAIYTALPAGLRVEWNSAEAFAAAIIVHNGIEQPYPGSEVLALAKIEPITEGRVTLMLPGAIVSGLVFQQTVEGWKYVISGAVVDDYIAKAQTEMLERYGGTDRPRTSH